MVVKASIDLQDRIVDSMLAHESTHHSGLGFSRPLKNAQEGHLMPQPIAFVRGKDQALLQVLPLECADTPTRSGTPTPPVSDYEDEDVILFVPPLNPPKSARSVSTPGMSHLTPVAPPAVPSETSSLSTQDIPDTAPPRAVPPTDAFATQQNLISLSLSDADPEPDRSPPVGTIKPAKLSAAQKRKLKREGRARRKSASRAKPQRAWASQSSRPTQFDSDDEDVDLPPSAKAQGKVRAPDQDAVMADYLADMTTEDLEDLAQSSFAKHLGQPAQHMTKEMLQDEIDLEEAKDDPAWQTSSDEVYQVDDNDDDALLAAFLDESDTDEEDDDVSSKDSSDEEDDEVSSKDSSDEDDGADPNKWFDSDFDLDRGKSALIRAIESGDFDGLEDELLVSNRKARKAQRVAFDSEDDFVEELQLQWQKDRQRKSERKKARLAQRLESHPTKANIKKAKRAGVEVAPMRQVNMHQVHLDIREFLMTPERPALNLPPMSKKDRVVVHLLAECYFLRSQSRGSGERRFPTLTRTALSTLVADQRKVAGILAAASGDPQALYAGKSGKGRTKALWKELSGERGTGRPTPSLPAKNRDGQVVGAGASAIGQDNIGYRLLQRMGWDESRTIGLSGGLSAPLQATIKTSRGGLGH